MGWATGLCSWGIGALLVGLLYVAATDPIRWNKRATRRRAKAAIKRRKKLRILNRDINNMRPGAFQSRRINEWTRR